MYYVLGLRRFSESAGRLCAQRMALEVALCMLAVLCCACRKQ
jgi:hypothetical protein